MTVPIEVLLGPYGLLAAVLVAVGILWRDHVRRDQKIEDQNDLLTKSVESINGTLSKQNEVIRQALKNRGP